MFPKRHHLRWLLLVPAVAGTFLFIFFAWPPSAEFLHPSPLPAVQVEDRNGRLLYEVRGPETGSFRFVPLTEMPQSILHAIVAVEDRDFFAHPGVNFLSMLRAAWQNVTTGRVVSGGSGITQQLVRNRLRPARRTYAYKALEALLALKLERHVSKEEILESYLNTVYFGHQAYGIAAAAKTFFGKSPSELSLAESSLLAGLVQSPSALDPFGNMPRAKERQGRVLSAMVDAGVLSEPDARSAGEQAVVLTRDRIDIRAPHFVFWLQSQRPEAFREGGHLRTTLDLDLQTQTEEIVRRKLEALEDKNVTSAAVVVLDAKTGEVLAMVGSADYFDADHDGAVNVAVSARQPGSALKPFTYALALARGDTAATTVADVETQFFTQDGNPYTPRNYDFGEHGLVRYRSALANSYNIAAVKVLEKVGVAALLDFLKAAGISTLTREPEHYGLALTLGSGEVTLLELSSAYAMLARGGETLAPRILPSDPPASGTRILDPKVAWLITDILSDDEARLAEFGEEGPLSLPFPAAAKTGTTRNSRDNWTLGYTPDVVVGVWVGNADNSPMRGTSGVTGAGPIFHDVMLASARAPRSSFERPDGIVSRTICTLSGGLPTPDCPRVMDEWFVAGTEPGHADPIFRRIAIDTRNGLLATDVCDPAYVEQRSFAVFPPEVKTWARENGWPQPPLHHSPLCPSSFASSDSPGPSVSSWIQILEPKTDDEFQLDPLIPDASERVIFKGQADDGIRSAEWRVDGVVVGTGIAPDFRLEWKPTPGWHELELKAGETYDKRRFGVMR